MTYPEAEAFLFALPRFADAGAAAYQPGLERMEALLAAMGAPHRAFPTLHVAGTNGKGSTASTAAALLTATGRRVGLHTSPHLWHLAERMRVDGVPAPESWIAGAVGRYRDALEAAAPSFFEATVALSLCYFADEKVDAAVVEVGLGGRLDATNVIPARVAAVTSIALDHTDLLGPTLAHIAREKAGIFKKGAPALTAAHQPGVLAVLRDEAARRGTHLENVRETVAIAAGRDGLTFTTPAGRYPGVRLALAGAHQRANTALALRAVEVFLGGAPGASVADALARVPQLSGLRARLETVRMAPRVVVDVCHNPAGLAAALDAVAPGGAGQLSVVFGVMADKDVAGMAALLARHAARVYPVSPGGARALPAGALAGYLERAGAPVQRTEGVAEAAAHFLAHARPADVLLVAGSHGVAAALDPTVFAETRRNPFR